MNFYLFAAYTLIFTLIFVYLAWLHRRQTDLQEKVDRLEKENQKAEGREKSRMTSDE